MIVSYLRLKNWRNFKAAEAHMGRRVFLVGPNACGKSNFLDAIRFLSDIAAETGGGLQAALEKRGGLSSVKCLHATKGRLEIEAHFSESAGTAPLYKYELALKREQAGTHRSLIAKEKVTKGGTTLVERPDDRDAGDAHLLTQTALQQSSQNVDFRDMCRCLQSALYLHLVPQLLRHPQAFGGQGLPGDPYGQDFMNRIANTPKGLQKTRLKRIEGLLKKVIPHLKDLRMIWDKMGIPHLTINYEHWRIHGARQYETEFSDGTLRLIGLCWTLLTNDSVLLLEEPELSLHSEVVRKLALLFHEATSKTKRKSQVIVSTHSWELLNHEEIAGEEVFLFSPAEQGTVVTSLPLNQEIRDLLESGFTVAEAVRPYSAAPGIAGKVQLELFGNEP